MKQPVTIAIFAKAPVAGFAKTRLIPAIGADAAAALQAKLISRTISVCRSAEVGPVELWCTPDESHACFKHLAAQGNLELQTQCSGDIGARMQDAFERLCHRRPVLLIGTDCLVLEPNHLRTCAIELVGGADGVFLPVEDGGYFLVGLRQPQTELFRAIPWNTDAVMAVTRDRSRAIGLRIVEPATLWDLDTPEDYVRAVKSGLIQSCDLQIGDQ